MPIAIFNGYQVVTSDYITKEVIYLVPRTIKRTWKERLFSIHPWDPWVVYKTIAYEEIVTIPGDPIVYDNMLVMHPKTWEQIKDSGAFG